MSDKAARLLDRLQARFEANMHRHEGVDWKTVARRLDGEPKAVKVLERMEASGGEPDVIGREGARGPILFCDCSAESPEGRRSLCYDREALEARKKHKPEGSAVEAAGKIGIALLTEEQYRALQELDEFDRKTSSWILTPDDVRDRGGALFCDRRYSRVFTYHNGADSYYAARGFRGLLAL